MGLHDLSPTGEICGESFMSIDDLFNTYFLPLYHVKLNHFYHTVQIHLFMIFFLIFLLFCVSVTSVMFSTVALGVLFSVFLNWILYFSLTKTNLCSFKLVCKRSIQQILFTVNTTTVAFNSSWLCPVLSTVHVYCSAAAGKKPLTLNNKLVL